MTDQNHALNRTLAHLIRAGMDPEDAAALTAQLRDEARAAAWDDPQARTLAADAQSWNYLRAQVLLTVDDPHIWDSGADEAAVLGAWVLRLAASRHMLTARVPETDLEDTQPIAILGSAEELYGVVREELPHRPCGGNGGREHAEHLFDRAGESFFCPGVAASIPHQAGPGQDHADE